VRPTRSCTFADPGRFSGRSPIPGQGANRWACAGHSPGLRSPHKGPTQTGPRDRPLPHKGAHGGLQNAADITSSCEFRMIGVLAAARFTLLAQVGQRGERQLVCERLLRLRVRCRGRCHIGNYSGRSVLGDDLLHHSVGNLIDLLVDRIGDGVGIFADGVGVDGPATLQHDLDRRWRRIRIDDALRAAKTRRTAVEADPDRGLDCSGTTLPDLGFPSPAFQAFFAKLVKGSSLDNATI
jgi:hypothetical protein